MNISVFGIGYVGCVTSACLADMGNHVICYDVSNERVDAIKCGKSPIKENQLKDIISRCVSSKALEATNDIDYAVQNTDISFITVGTPSGKDGNLDLSQIYDASKSIGKSLSNKEGFHTVIIRSTVKPGTNEKVSKIIAEESGKVAEKEFTVVSNPEFLREGTAVEDFLNPEIILIGTSNGYAEKQLTNLYKNINAEIVVSDIRTAEIMKYVNNSFHALKICFANEIGTICDSLEIDGSEVMKILCMDKKLNISDYYLKPGFAYGGSCLPKDLKGLNKLADENHVKVPILSSIENSNFQQILNFEDKIKKIGSNRIGFLEITFKQGTDDTRSSPTITLIDRLIESGYFINIYDENLSSKKIESTISACKNKNNFSIKNSIDEVIKDSDVIVCPRRMKLMISEKLEGTDKKTILL